MAAAPVALLSASSRGSRTHVDATPFSGRLWVSGTARPAAVCARPALPAREATAPRAFTGSAASSRRPQHGLPNALPPTAERSADQPARPLPRDVENVADDPNLANPLLRHQRLSTAWMGVILEFEGIVLQSTWEAHLEAWLTVAEEEGKSPPLQWEVKRAEGMKNEQVVSEVFHWTRNPSEIRRISERKEEVYRDLTADIKPTLMPGVKQLLDILNKNDVPVALASSDPERRVMHGLEAVGVLDAFSAVVTAGDCQYSRPDPEPYLYAAQLLQRPPVRCVVIGASNASIEGAHEAGMQCVVAAGRSPIYELTSGDLVVKDLTEISFMNLKQLFQLEQLTTLSSEDDQIGPTPELEYEKEESLSTQTATMTLDYPYDDFL